MLLLCSLCGADPDFAGPLCKEPVPYEPSLDRFICKACVLSLRALNVAAQEMEADLRDRQEHEAGCRWCYGNRGLLPAGLRFQMCVERRRKEARHGELVSRA